MSAGEGALLLGLFGGLFAALVVFTPEGDEDRPSAADLFVQVDGWVRQDWRGKVTIRRDR